MNNDTPKIMFGGNGHKTIWELAKANNAKAKTVRRKMVKSTERVALL